MSQKNIFFSEKKTTKIPDDFLSVTLDISSVIGGKWWAKSETRKAYHSVPRFNFNNKHLPKYIGALKPLSLRIGGTESDMVYYTNASKKIPNKHDKYILDKKLWLGIDHFCKKNDLKLTFTLNAGAGPRKNHHLKLENALELIKTAKKLQTPVKCWELGNEINAFIVSQGFLHTISPKKYSKEYGRLKNKLHKQRIAGPGSILWPRIGEPVRFIKKFMQYAGQNADIISWHYYPQHSYRLPFYTRKANIRNYRSASFYKDLEKHAKKINFWKNKYCPNAKIWLTEIGNAMYGGEPRLSQSFISSLWWLDALGTLAINGTEKVFRQTLIGSDYGLINEQDYRPNADYFASLLWKALMGNIVYTAKSENKKLRLYLHKKDPSENKFTLLIININDKSQEVKIPSNMKIQKIYNCTSITPLDREVYINKKKVTLKNFGSILKKQQKEIHKILCIERLSYSFIGVLSLK
jgi:heparanase 1